MSSDHERDHGATGSRLLIGLCMTLVFVGIELVAGLASRSLALVSDSAHNFADALALGLSWYGMNVAARPSNARRTFGYHRVSILTALVNAVTLVVVALYIFWEAAERLRHPASVESVVMIGVALVALAMNVWISSWLHAEAKHDLNVRSAYVHMLGDAVASAGVAVAGVIVQYTGWLSADPAVSVLIGLLILWSSWSIVRECVDILLESTPAGLDMSAVEKSIAGVPGVRTVHDLHVWTVGSGLVACSVHVVVDEQSIRNGQNVLRGVNTALKSSFGIGHSTIQVEVEGCDAGDMYCVVKGSAHSAEHPHPTEPAKGS